jgi:hypothetical protein
MMGAGWGRGRMSRKKKWIIAGIVGGSLVALAVGLGVYFGTKKPSSPPSPSSSPSPRPPISSSSSPPSPSQSAGPLVPGTYQVTMVKQSDPCANILDIVCVTPLYANWTFTSTDGKYDIAYNHNRDSVNVGAADSSGTLTFAFPAVTVTEANNCNYLNAMGVSLQLSTNSFSGAVVYGRTNPSACLDNRNYRIPQGAACNCEYTI